MKDLRSIYKEKIGKELTQELGLANVMQLPRIEKIVINSGIGEFRDNRESVESFAEELSMLTGQRVSPRKARLSESGFKIRKGDIVAFTVTLRGQRMWSFIEKLTSIVLPRVKDFRGLSLKSFDPRGNYSFGLKEHVIFPEVNPNKIKGSRGLQITFGIKNGSKEKSQALLEKLGIPFIK